MRLGGLHGPMIAQRSAAPGKHALGSATANEEGQENWKCPNVRLSEVKLTQWGQLKALITIPSLLVPPRSSDSLRISESSIGN